MAKASITLSLWIACSKSHSIPSSARSLNHSSFTNDRKSCFHSPSSWKTSFTKAVRANAHPQSNPHSGKPIVLCFLSFLCVNINFHWRRNDYNNCILEPICFYYYFYLWFPDSNFQLIKTKINEQLTICMFMTFTVMTCFILIALCLISYINLNL